MPLDLVGGNSKNRNSHISFFRSNSGSIPAIYRDVFEMLNLHGLDKLTFAVFVPLFESHTLTKTILNQASRLKR